MKALLILLFLSITTFSFSQYSPDPATFLKEIDKTLSKSDNAKTKVFMEEFEPNWLTNFSSEYQNRVVSTCNLLEAKGRPAFPDIYGYLISVHSFVKSNQPKTSFETWHKTIDDLLNSKKSTNFQTFIEFCADFFTDGTIHKELKYKWTFTGGQYLFEFENNRPKITFSNGDLGCYMFDLGAGKKDNPFADSMVVYKTTGVFEPFVHRFTGRGGDITWSRTGLDPAKNYAEITDYKLSLKQTKLECDSVLMHTEYYEKPLWGDLKDYCKIYNREIDKIYPSFTSFSKEVVRKDIIPDVDYLGGFALEAGDFAGIGFDKNPAKLVFKQNGKPFVTARALSFKINEKSIKANDCEVVMYLNDKDTLYHPGLQLIYDATSTPKIEFVRANSGLGMAPFKNSYHDLDMYVDEIIWTKGDPNLNFTWNQRDRPNKEARFESKDFFSARDYQRIQGMNKTHPLAAIYNYTYKYDMPTIAVNKIAGPMGYTTDQALPILLDLAQQGFITYNSSRKEITVQPKTKKYIDARAGKVDYDNIVFVANLEQIPMRDTLTPDGRRIKENVEFNDRAIKINERKKLSTNFGYLNLTSLDLSLNEVDPIPISPLQNVVIFPGSGELLIKEEMDFVFEGAIMAGKLEVYLNEASFDNEQFRINLIDVKQAMFRVRPIYGGEGLIAMYSHFEDISGYIEVDDPNNRSGKNNRDFPQYPILNSTKDSYVFYDHSYVYDGVYDSVDFYFKAEPFKFDSLDNFDEYSMSFDGEFRSAGIFPTFKEKLTIQEDYSFGFKTKAPAGGFDFYGDYAKFDNEIRLSNEGLRGAGQIDFETSSSKSENFVFFPDSTMGLSEYVNRGEPTSAGKQVPDVTCGGAMVTFVPKEEILKARAYSEPLMFFNKEAEMKGVTFLTKGGMTGRGLMYFKEAELGSYNFNYGRWTIDADTADFNLLAKGQETTNPNEENPLSFDSRNLNAHVDFQERKGEFKSNDGTSIVEFPKNQYICFMDMFTWLMDNDEIELSKNEDAADVSINTELDLAGSNFFSIHPEQDSLNFSSPKAKFVLKENVLYCDKVEYIDVADARISPPDGKVTIRKKAKMDEFEGAEILANSITKFHKIVEAKVRIDSRLFYQASGKYPYTTDKGFEQIIFFADIKPDTVYTTTAKGSVKQEENFQLSDRFGFYGNVELNASNQFLTFDGATRIVHDCDKFAKNWLKFRTEVDPASIQIPVTGEMKDLEGNSIAVGMVRRNGSGDDSLDFYPAFLSAMERPNDFLFFTSSGVLTFVEDAQEFRIASPEKLENRAEAGNYLALHVQSCSMEGEGLVDFNMNLPGVEFKTYGTVDYNASKDIASFHVSGGLDGWLDPKMIEFISDEVASTEGLGTVDFKRTTLKMAITETAGKEKAESIEGDYAIGGPEKVGKLPKEIADYPFYFTNLRFTWNNRALGLVSQPITGVVAMNGKSLFKDFTVQLMIQYQVEGGDFGTKLGLMIQLPGAEGMPGNIYFMSLEKTKNITRAYIYSTNKEMMAYLGELKDDKLKNKKVEMIPTKKANRMSMFQSLVPN
ncbi:hypothetical protein K6119_17845 [Paracrocinitomix mangrovi]|uniref:hypothetical protein n=1 Tax=Paracrocinitomix mangrovi TaxID=2862509 RepID=UPI001C8E701F|nr:hypothetical protein [Paracrocinitomix mangrovi]UKN01589.1 hypothetical protein K6119_17845 [Paracrocinitomix mangrovi]